jgi:hypothetical protein
MGLKADARLANLVKSLDAYLDEHLKSVDPVVPVDWEGTPFQDAGIGEWIQPRLLEPVRSTTRYYRQVGEDLHGQGLQLFYNINLFVRPQLVPDPAYRLLRLRDRVLEWFTVRTRVAIKNFDGDQGTLGTAIVDEIVTDRRITDPDLSAELQQWNITPVLRWTESVSVEPTG